jgi:hypothetical protein
MGLYWAAVDNHNKKYFEPPKGFSNKIPGLYHASNPFPAMLVMMNSRGHNFEIENDSSWDCYYSRNYRDITDEVYKELLNIFPLEKESS